MNMNNTREKEEDVHQAKQEADTFENRNNKKVVVPSRTSVSSSATSRQWGGFKNPRIVRVSRTFGGKDRHSKVCTIRGLRDRRIRLSVPTAIQLYDLQDRLGLSQPSKVVDWLLDVTKNEIDKLPPLQIPPENFSQFQQATPSSHHHHLFSPHQDNPSSIDAVPPHHQASISHLFNMKEEGDAETRGININEETNLEVERENDGTMEKAQETHLDENSHFGVYEEEASSQNNQLYAQNFFPLANHHHHQSSLQGLLNSNNNNNNINALLPFNPYLHWEPSHLSLSHFGNPSLENSQLQQQQPSSAGSHQLYLCPSISTVQPILPPQNNPFLNSSSSSLIENDDESSRQMNHYYPGSSSYQIGGHNNSLMMPTTLHLISSNAMKPFALNARSNPKENDDDDLSSKGRMQRYIDDGS